VVVKLLRKLCKMICSSRGIPGGRSVIHNDDDDDVKRKMSKS
jgi:hypothetical protein